MATPEHYQGSAERSVEVERAAAERAAELRETESKHGEKLETNSEHLAQEARAEAEKQARPAEDYRPAAESEKVAPKQTHHFNTDHKKAYEETMATVQQHMSAPARAFSKVIHNKAVEEVSDVTGNTIARPNAILSGSLFALLLTLALYVEARYAGHSLSGFEMIGAFILGWIIGIIFDFLRTMVTGKR